MSNAKKLPSDGSPRNPFAVHDGDGSVECLGCFETDGSFERHDIEAL